MASLDELRAEARKRYADYPVTLSNGTVVTLRAPLRLSSEARTELRGMQQQISTMQDAENYSDASLLDLLREMLITVADDEVGGKALVDEIGDDLAVLQTLFEDYSERTQAGEASHSAG